MLPFQPARLSGGPPAVFSSPLGHNRSLLSQGTDQVCFGSTNPQNSLEDWATAEKRLRKFYKHHRDQAPQIETYLKTLFPPELGTLAFRVKTEESFWHKAYRVYETKNRASGTDFLGARLVLKQGSFAESEVLVERLREILKNKDLTLLKLFNSGESHPYFIPSRDIPRLEEVSKFKRMRFKRPAENLSTDCTFVNLTLWKPGPKKHTRGTYFNLQICGPNVYPLMEVEHLFYAVVIKGKSLPKDLKDIESKLQMLQGNQPALYAAYLRGWYRHARFLENNLGFLSSKPNYPAELPPELKVENLAKRLAAQDPKLAPWIVGNPLFEAPPDPTIVPLT